MNQRSSVSPFTPETQATRQNWLTDAGQEVSAHAADRVMTFSEQYDSLRAKLIDIEADIEQSFNECCKLAEDHGARDVVNLIVRLRGPMRRHLRSSDEAEEIRINRLGKLGGTPRIRPLAPGDD